MHSEHLNYCRQFRKQAAAKLAVPSLEKSQRFILTHLVDLCAASQKFILPDGGFLLVDKELRALSGGLPLRLPHQFIALEFSLDAGTSTPDKVVIFAREQ